jgi:hypothetical protein
MRVFIALGIFAMLALGVYGEYAEKSHAGMTRNTQQPMSQSMMLAAQEGHSGMMMGTDKMSPAPSSNTGMSGCGMGGGSTGDMKAGSKGGMMGGMGDKGMTGCPMMTQGKEGKGMSGCCCMNMGNKETPKKPT